ncbi:MAG TPA: hypothetical protein VFW09_11650 [Solirubrobacteraceae bacterium]|nr:hypothetical protein [Solirubrobacteraceae bacterium]
MPPTDRFVISFAAEPPRQPAPYGNWADTLTEYFLQACHAIDAEGADLGEAGEIAWFPDRRYDGRTYVPAVARTTTGYELFGFVSFAESEDDGAPQDFEARAEFTSETADSNPDWRLDLNDDVIGSWRGENGNVAEMTLVWGVPLIGGGSIVTAELADLAVDQCALYEERFTLVAPDNYRGDYLEIMLWDARGRLLADESLYVDDDDEESSESGEDSAGDEDDASS